MIDRLCAYAFIFFSIINAMHGNQIATWACLILASHCGICIRLDRIKQQIKNNDNQDF